MEISRNNKIKRKTIVLTFAAFEVIIQLNNTYILLGADSGDREASLTKSIELINREVGHVIRKSSIYETEPWGFVSDSVFLNQVIQVFTLLKPYSLLESLNSIESSLGRTRIEGHYESRPIDLDILFFNDEIIDSGRLQIPHPKFHLRKFAIIPMKEIAEDYIHPSYNMTVSQLLNRCPDQMKVKLFRRNGFAVTQ